MNRNKENWIAYTTILRREIHRFMRIWFQTIIPPIITTILYFFIFGKVIGERVGEINGLPYIQYIAPGLIIMWVIMGSYSNVTNAVYMSKFQRSIEELLMSPTPNILILGGYLSGGIARGFLVGLIIATLTLLFTHIYIQHVFLTLIIIFLTALLFSLVGFINGILSRNFDDVMIVPTFILTPLNYLGGVFYSIKMLPHFWQMVSLANPIFYIISLFRYSMLGTADVNIYIALGFIVTFNIILFILTWHMFNKGIGIRH